MVEDRPRTVRLAASINIALGVLTLLSILLARDRLAAFWFAGFLGLGLILWGGLEAWAATQRRLRGTKLLAMFMAILGVALAGSSFLLQDAGPYRIATLLLGAAVVIVSVVDAFVSPDEDRRRRFEPRRRDDVAPRPPGGRSL